jgi:hypothetical protein
VVFTKLRYYFGMMYMDGNDLRAQGSGERLPEISPTQEEEGSAMAIVGWTSVAVGIAAVGLYVGRELRARYKFNHRTQYDFFSHAGDSVCSADYGTGI